MMNKTMQVFHRAANRDKMNYATNTSSKRIGEFDSVTNTSKYKVF
jgi:hypothetical protein